MSYHYNFHNLFSLSTNIDDFHGLLHAFASIRDADTSARFRFVLDNKLKISLRKKPLFNVMLGYDAETNSVEFAYPWIRPVYARLTFGKNEFVFSCNKTYLRFSHIAGKGWQSSDIFRSLLMISLIKSGMYMVHAASIKLGDEGILIPSFANTGKTTTSWMLAQRGAKYLTDELAILDSRGNCLSCPSSSLITAGLATALGLSLTGSQKLSMILGRLKTKLFSLRFVTGGIRLYPEDFFGICDIAKITKVAFIQNGVDDARKVSTDVAITRFMAIRNYELGWDSNPFLNAESFFNPKFEMETLRRTEQAFVRSFLSGINDIYMISSSNGSHYKAIENYQRNIDVRGVLSQVEAIS